MNTRASSVPSVISAAAQERITAFISEAREWPIWRPLMTFTKGCLWILWTFLAFCLVATWFNSLRHAKHDAVRYSELELLVLVLIGLLAGFEIAFADLRDKDPEQVREGIRDLLRSMQIQGEAIYQAREWLGVALIVGAALLTEFEWDVPSFIGELLAALHLGRGSLHLTPEHRKLLLSLIFTTFPVVWFAEGPAKFLSFWNSEKFLTWFRFTWPLVRVTIFLMQVLQLNAITELLLFPIRGAWEKQKRNLPPSDPALYLNMLKRYGYGADEVETRVFVQSDGSARIEQSFTLHVLAGSRTTFDVKQNYSSACLAQGAILKSAVFCPVPGEGLSEVEDQIKAARQATLPSGYERIPQDYLTVTASVEPSRPNRMVVDISSVTPLGTETPLRGAVLMVTSESTWDKGAFETIPGKEDEYWFDFGFPYRKAVVSIEFEETAGLGFSSFRRTVRLQGNDHPLEERRISGALSTLTSRQIVGQIQFALPGAKYVIGWTVWKR